MWNITKEAKEKFAKCNLLPIHETDEEWEIVLREAKEEGEDYISYLKEDLEEAKEELLQILPDRFIRYVKDGILNQPTLPKSVREDYLQWIREAEVEFEKILDAASENTMQSVSTLSTAVQEVFSESLHDAIIERIERKDDTLHIHINTDGGFSSKSHIHFSFHHVITEESDELLQVGQWIIYYELQKTKSGYAFRVLFDCPDSEWTIGIKNIDATYYYRPACYTILRDEEKLEETSFLEFIKELNPDFRYWFITPDVTYPIQSFSENIQIENGSISFEEDKVIVSLENERFSYDLDGINPISFIYTDVYEDPYAYQNEPLPTDDIEAAAFSQDLELQVRAWNTMYTNPNDLSDIINRVLLKMEITEENEMMVCVYVNHFYNEGILTETVKEKYRTIID